jgi:hypothetical protein
MWKSGQYLTAVRTVRGIGLLLSVMDDGLSSRGFGLYAFLASSSPRWFWHLIGSPR